MFINPKIAIEKGWIKGIKDPAKQVQPNAIDFTLDKVMALSTEVLPFISETSKIMRALDEITADPFLEEWMLEGGRVYDGTSDVYVEVPEGVAAILYTRSTFARNGVIIASGLYDSGFKGNVGFTIYTIGGPIIVRVGTRIGQIAFVGAESAGLYTGGYNHPEGTHYTEQCAMVPPPPGGAIPQSSLGTPIGAPIVKGEQAKHLEDTHKWNSDQTGKPAGTKSFI